MHCWVPTTLRGVYAKLVTMQADIPGFVKLFQAPYGWKYSYPAVVVILCKDAKHVHRCPS